jgi:hypothetical protein
MGELGVGQAIASTSDFGYMFFSTRNTGAIGERMRITATGNVGIGTSAPGAKLHVSGAISGSSINFGQDDLNFYEEATWTPTIDTVNNNISGVDYAEPTSGVYTRIGNVVHAWFEINVNSISSAGTGTAIIGGLPYSANTNVTVFSAVTITEGDILTVGSSGDQVKGYVPSDTDYIQLDYYSSGTGGFGVNSTAGWRTGGGTISGYVTYQV